MILYGLKLWTNNEDLFEEAVTLHTQKKFDFIELYNNPKHIPDFKALAKLKEISVSIHNPNDHGFHEFILGQEQLAIWRKSIALADFFSSQYIVIHPGRNHTFESFLENLRLIDDPRVLVENMAGRDIFKEVMFGQKLENLLKIKQLKKICFDFEKAVKAAVHQRLDYKPYITECIQQLQPEYFHISGGNARSSVDEHTNLWDSDIDFKWIKDLLNKIAKDKDILLVFETPKGKGLANDIDNINFFKEL